MVAVLLAIALLAGVPSDRSVDPAAERAVIVDINRERARLQLGELVADEDLHAIAVARAADMAARGYFDHRTPEGTTAFVDALQRSAYHCNVAGENIALAPTVADAQRGLWQSPSHRSNLLDARFRRAGIAVVRFAPSRIYVIQVLSD